MNFSSMRSQILKHARWPKLSPAHASMNCHREVPEAHGHKAWPLPAQCMMFK